MRPSSLSPARGLYPHVETPTVTPAPQGTPAPGTPPSSSPTPGQSAFGNLPRSPAPSTPSGSRSPLSFAWRRPPWSQQLREAYAAGHAQQAHHAAPPAAGDIDLPRPYEPRRRTVQAAREGRIPLARARPPGGSAADNDVANAVDWANTARLIDRIAAVAWSGPQARGEASSSSSRPRTEDELDAQIASNDPAVILALATEAKNHACGAAEAARAGSMAALVATHQRALVAGDSPQGRPSTLRLSESMQAARAHVGKLETTVDMLEAAFGPFGDDDEDDADASNIRDARGMIEQARMALGTIESDTVHCFVAQAIDEHRLPPEAAVLGQAAALRELHPAVFELDQGGCDPQVLEGMAKLASSTARDLRAMMGASDVGDRGMLQTLGGGAVDLPQTLRDASHAVMKLRADCPQGATQDALGSLFNAIDEAGVWLQGQALPTIGTRAALPPHSPLITPAAHTPLTNETVNARMNELGRQRDALAQLPRLAAPVSTSGPRQETSNRALGRQIEHLIANAMGEHAPLDARIELARLAMHFAPDNAGERVRLGRALTALALRVDAPTTSEVRATLGNDGDYSEQGSAALTRQALFDRLGDVMADLHGEDRLRFARSLDEGWDVRDSRGSSDVQRSALAIAHRRLTDRSSPVPEVSIDEEQFGVWLGDSGKRKTFIAEYINAYSVSRHNRAWGNDAQIASYTDNRSVVGQLVRHASNMTALRGHRHHFVKLVKDLFAADNEQISYGHRPTVGSAQRFELLQAMVAQLPTFGHAAGDRQTVSDTLGLVLREMSEKEMQPRHKLRLANELIAVTEYLSTSRFSSSDAAQSHAIDSIAHAMRVAAGPDCTALLRQVLASSQAWSGQRSASAELARTRGKKRFMIASSLLLPPVAMMHAATYAAETLQGRSSPKDEALKMVLETIERRLEQTVDAGRPAQKDLIPVYGDLLHQLLDASAQPGGKSNAARLERTLSCIVRGGLPAGGSARARNERISMVFGDDPSMRAAVARSLTRAIKDKTGPASSPFGRLASARYLQNLLAAGAGELGEAERQAAIAAIHRAASSKSLDSAGRRETAMLDTLVSEALRDDMPLKPEVLARTASQTINVLQRVPRAIQAVGNALSPDDRRVAGEPVDDAAERMPRLMSFYPTLNAQARREIAAALRDCAPETPLQHIDPDARGYQLAQQLAQLQAQLPLLAFASSLSRFTGKRPADANEILQLHAKAWQRLNTTNQAAALNDMFNAYDEATPAGREAVTSFVGGLDSRTFVSAAVKLIGSTVADETMRSALGEAECGRIVGAVLQRLRALPGEDASDLISGVLAGGVQLPQALIDGFVNEAHMLQPRTLAQVLSIELGRVCALPRNEAATALAGWNQAARAVPPDSPQRQTLALFMAIATRAHPALAARAVPPGQVPVPEEAAQQLSSVLPGFDESLQDAVLAHIAGEHAPPAMRREIVDDLFAKFAAANPRQRRLAIELGGPAGIGRGLEALAKTFGAPLFREGQVVRPGFDQTFLHGDGAGGIRGRSSTLRSALEDRARRPEEIGVTLETIADRFLALPETPFQQQFVDLFETLVANRRLTPHLLRRVIDTLALTHAQQSKAGSRLLHDYGQQASPPIAEVLRRARASTAPDAMDQMHEQFDAMRPQLDEIRNQRVALLHARRASELRGEAASTRPARRRS